MAAGTRASRYTRNTARVEGERKKLGYIWHGGENWKRDKQEVGSSDRKPAGKC